MSAQRSDASLRSFIAPTLELCGEAQIYDSPSADGGNRGSSSFLAGQFYARLERSASPRFEVPALKSPLRNFRDRSVVDLLLNTRYSCTESHVLNECNGGVNQKIRSMRRPIAPRRRTNDGDGFWKIETRFSSVTWRSIEQPVYRMFSASRALMAPHQAIGYTLRDQCNEADRPMSDDIADEVISSAAEIARIR
jgi:hypothetical protein